MEIIDAHSHFGIDMLWQNSGKIDEYMNFALAKGITNTFAMSVPCPIFFENGKKIIPSKYKHINGVIKYFSQEEDLKTKEILIKTIEKVENPYEKANNFVYEQCKNNMMFNYVPLIHPYFYSLDDFLLQIKRGAKIFKIHGIACGIIPNEIPEEFFRLIEYLKIPLLIHTDYSDKENLAYYNDAIHWYEVLKNYDIKVYFAHAVRLINDIVKKVNEDDRYIVGLGPDKFIGDPYTPMAEKEINYLEHCFSIFDMEKIVFDVDYPWNIMSSSDYNLDWNSINRIKLLLGIDEQKKVFSENIKKFIKR